MTVPVTKHGILLRSTENSFESQAVLNPSCITEEDCIHMLYRAVREPNYSTIGYCRIENDRVAYRHPEPILTAETPYEQHGVEDPRLTWFEGTYHLTYVAYDGETARTCYASATELPHFTKHGSISPPLTYGDIDHICRERQALTNGLADVCAYTKENFDTPYQAGRTMWDKDMVVFPTRIRGKRALLHRVRPNVQIVYFDDFSDLSREEFWRQALAELDTSTVLRREHWFENGYLGAGCPPIYTVDGWLLIYHAVQIAPDGQKIYRAAAALVDLDDPTILIGRLDQPLFGPDEEWERRGTVANVVFPTGASLRGDRLTIFYGAADSVIASASLSLETLLQALRPTQFTYDRSVSQSHAESSPTVPGAA